MLAVVFVEMSTLACLRHGLRAIFDASVSAAARGSRLVGGAPSVRAPATPAARRRTQLDNYQSRRSRRNQKLWPLGVCFLMRGSAGAFLLVGLACASFTEARVRLAGLPCAQESNHLGWAACWRFAARGAAEGCVSSWGWPARRRPARWQCRHRPAARPRRGTRTTTARAERPGA